MADIATRLAEINSNLDRIEENVANTYIALETKGATMPTDKNSKNLPDCVESITGEPTSDTWARPFDRPTPPTIAENVATPLFKLGIDGVIRKHIGFIDLISDDEGNIDVDTLHKEYIDLANRADGCINLSIDLKIRVFDIKLYAKDIDLLYELIKAEVPATTQSA